MIQRLDYSAWMRRLATTTTTQHNTLTMVGVGDGVDIVIILLLAVVSTYGLPLCYLVLTRSFRRKQQITQSLPEIKGLDELSNSLFSKTADGNDDIFSVLKLE